MKRILLYSFFCFASVHSILGQTALPPAYEINTDTATVQKLDSIYYQKLEDKEGKWTLEDVIRPPLSDKFHIRGSKPDGIDTNAIHTYWHRFRLKNVMSSPAKISFTSFVDYFDVFVKRVDSPWSHYKTGLLRPWPERDGLKATAPGIIPIVLAPGEEVLVYDRRQKMDATNFPTNPRFLSTEKLIQKEYVDYTHTEGRYYAALELTEAFMIGFLLVAFFYNLIFFRIIKEPVYLYFSLFLFFLITMRLYNIAGSYFQHESPALGKYVVYLSYSWTFIHFFLIQFVRYFFGIVQRYKTWDKCLNLLAWLWVAVNLVTVVLQGNSARGFEAMVVVDDILFPLIPLLLIFTLIPFIRSRDGFTRFVILGALPMLCLYGVFGWFADDGLIKSGDFLNGFITDHFRVIESACVLWFVLFFSLVLFFRYNSLRKENAQKQLDNERLAKEQEIEKNELIQQQKIQLEKDVAARTAELKQSLENLKLSQIQLIQAEKMASLGELTAGIAHEIQNPLNFVNNFSEVNSELVDELQVELKSGKIEDAISISNDIKENEQKINFHGKRADAIVKGMLQHSRSTSGQKELIDMNALADEYLRLAYHGLRAKDISFNVTMKTDFDPNIGKISVVPQDIGRVLLNLYNNAFYACHHEVDDSKNESDKVKGGMEEPTIWVSTRKIGDHVEVSVKDNGAGIPPQILDKIFQPFFTTKPTGQGTGLGLSLSYDIVKAHGGDILVEADQKPGVKFILKIPIG